MVKIPDEYTEFFADCCGLGWLHEHLGLPCKMEMTFVCSLLSSVFCTMTVGFVEHRLVFIAVMFSVSDSYIAVDLTNCRLAQISQLY